MLQGARLVTAQETEKGKFWAEAKVKSLTGGDPISARFMRQDFFTYEPQFKLVIAGNHKPGLRSVDEAIRRRIHLVPFTVTIPPNERDPGLAEKLRDEHGGILQWAIEGCRQWQENGLDPPPCVRARTDEYLDEQDPLASWIEECCTVGSASEAKLGDLYPSYTSHAQSAGERPETKREFSELLKTRGFERTRIGKQRARGLRGISLRGER